MQTPRKPFANKRASRGISLIIVLIMLVIIGITGATAMRTATSEQRATNNLRMETIAQQYAEAALRICEGQNETGYCLTLSSLSVAAREHAGFAALGYCCQLDGRHSASGSI